MCAKDKQDRPDTSISFGDLLKSAIKEYTAKAEKELPEEASQLIKSLRRLLIGDEESKKEK